VIVLTALQAAWKQIPSSSWRASGVFSDRYILTVMANGDGDGGMFLQWRGYTPLDLIHYNTAVIVKIAMRCKIAQ